jgi:imidazolonepropionase-like amidohydrolase
MLGYGMLYNVLQERGYWRQHRAEIRDAWKRGVKLQIGTDYPYAMPPVPGASLHQEMAAFVDAGIPELEVIRMATQEAARALGAGEDLGTLEAGKLADMVLLDGNPMEDIYNAQRVWRVIKGGWVFDPEELRPDHTDAEH